MPEFYQKNKDNLYKILYFLLFVFFIYLFFNYLIAYLAPFVLGYVLCLILYPLSHLLQTKLKFSNSAASLISIIVFLLIVIGLGISLIYRVIFEARLFMGDIPLYTKEALAVVDKWNTLVNHWMTLLPEGLQHSWVSVHTNFVSWFTSVLGSGVKTGSVGVMKRFPLTILIIVLGIVSSFFLIRDKKRIEAFLNRQLPDNAKSRIRVMRVGLSNALAGYVKAQLILMSITASICIIGLTLLQYPYALFVGLLISIVDALPILGTGITLLPWAAFCLALGNYQRAVGLVIVYLVVLVMRQICEPKILGEQIGIHPLVTLMSIYIGLKVFGVLGFILGPITVVTIKAFQKADLLPRFK